MMRSSLSLCAAGLLALATLACEDKVKPSVLPDVDSATLPQQESWNSRVVLSDSGVTTAVIEAGYIRVFAHTQQTLLSEGVVVHFLDPQGRETSVLTSREGRVDDRTNDLQASVDVRVVSSDSTVLTTSILRWDNRRRLIYTPEFVTIVSPTEKIEGHGLEADQHLRSYRIFRVSGESRTE